MESLVAHLKWQFKEPLTNEDNKRIHLYASYLIKFSQSALDKFIKGRLEHGDDYKSIDCHKEIEQELMDITAYNFINTNIQKHG